MSYNEDYRMAMEEEMSEEIVASRAKVKREVAGIEEEIRSLKRRERYYFGILGGVILAAGIFGFQTLQADGGQDPSGYNSTDYAQYVSYAQGSGTGSAGVASGGCGSSGSGAAGGCCGGGSGQTGTVDTSAIAKAGKEYYLQQTGTQQAVEAKVTDFGCHIQCDILESGNVIKSYAYRNNTFVEI